MTYKDPIKGIIYRTHVSEAAISIQFVSGVFFEAFKEKMHADYMISVDIDCTNFVSKCTTHIKGTKCDIKLDSHFKTVDLSGIGFRIWREERFSVIARSLFKRLMHNLDSQLEASSQCEPKSGDGIVICDQQENSTCGAETTTSDVNVAPMINVAPKCNVALKSNVAPKSNVAQKCNVADSSDSHFRNEDATEVLNLEKKGNVEFTAEIITSWYKQGVDIPNAQVLEINQMIDYYSSNQELEGKNYDSSQGNGVVKDQNLNSERHNLDLQGLMTGRMENRATPVFTSRPITLRQDNITLAGQQARIFVLFEQLDSNIKTIKSDILQQMEYRLDELNSSQCRHNDGTNYFEKDLRGRYQRL